jgi:hypothetical protein
VPIRGYLEALEAGGKKALAQGAAELPEEDRAQALIDLLTQMSDDEADAAALNQLLEEMGSPVRVALSDRGTAT